ncbi:MAG: hypothetical protein H0U57_05655 [Tatlockia sp.]|nr:hypothetical protein [Tatlockia sp.]
MYGCIFKKIDQAEQTPIETIENTETSTHVETVPQKLLSACDDDNKQQVPHKITFGDFFFTALAVYENGGGKVEQLAAQSANRPKL